ncbi:MULTISPECIES: Hsp20/alpha crystallin family protein [Streptomyces]|uniref:Hsp20/alpha crystallin family protein n=1 Tax=Streptomyces TaxID=1883 RepID=UPI0019637ADE|nr:MULTISPECIES: Hsp20/alpha crystallin family protein [Streptomyces]QRX95494.1 Hsp20/alpha crystallin family protein [Streptomyces noursei]UJB45662.1 Hsp20/alpha crystallin family protein [Streptomyces sp. A1-5]
MNLPIRQRSGGLRERGRGWPQPMAEFQELFDRMNHFLESASFTPSLTEPTAFAPPADLHETDEAYLVECELPGIKREDIDVEVGEHEVSISGELTACEREGAVRRRGRPTGSFEYRALLPVDVKSDEVTAALSDGVLTVTIPKAQPATPRHIEIQG